MATLFAIDRIAEPDQPAIRFRARLPRADLGMAYHVGRAAQALWIVTAVEILRRDAAERHLVGPHQIAEPQLIWIEASLARNRIHEPFHRRADTSPRDAAIGHDRRLVGADRRGSAPVRRHIIGTRQVRDDLCAFQAGRERIDRISTGIDMRHAIETENHAVSSGVNRCLIMMFAAVRRRREVFAPILKPFDRPVELEACP